MTVETVSVFLALLAVSAQVATVGSLALAGLATATPALRPAQRALSEMAAPVAVWAAFAVALVATVGSLYYSEVAGFEPCRLCWFQRICMYPLVPILGVGAARRDRSIGLYAGPLAVLGSGISAYHVLLQRYPSLGSSTCDPENPCTLVWVEELGFLTIPTMAMTGFAVIARLLFLFSRRPK